MKYSIIIKLLEFTKMEQRTRKQKYSVDFKIEAVKYAEENGFHQAQEIFGASRKSIREWKNQLSELLKVRCNKRRKTFSLHNGKESKFKHMEPTLALWMEDIIDEGYPITAKLVIQKVMILSSDF